MNTNFSITKIIKVIAKLVGQPIRDIIEGGFLEGVDCVPINLYRASFNIKIKGRRWLAPLHRLPLSTFEIKQGTFIVLRKNGRSCDMEFSNEGKDTEVYTLLAQEWREKEGYFMLIPQERLKGSLADNVAQITRYRRENPHGRDETGLITRDTLIGSTTARNNKPN